VAHRKAQSKYRRSKKGKKKNKIYEKRRRKVLRKQKSVADRDTTLGSFGCKILSSCSYQPDVEVNVYRQDFSVQTGKSRTGRCHFCGSVGTIVDKFPRRGYKSCKSSRTRGHRSRGPVIRPSVLMC
jgi:hypothetical protein